MRESEPTSYLCVACGHDLAGRAVGETCPECGGKIVENPFHGAWRDVTVRRRFKFGACARVVGAVRTPVDLLRNLDARSARSRGVSHA
jgi:DNA-directed RNA polymerase subunit RPC12/RpoP